MTTLDQNTAPLSDETLAKIRRRDEWDLRIAEKTEGALDEIAWERHVLLDEVDRLTAAARDSDAYTLDTELAKAEGERADLANQVSVLKDHVAALESGTRAALAIDWDTLRAAVAGLDGVEPSAVSAVLGAFRQAVAS